MSLLMKMRSTKSMRSIKSESSQGCTATTFDDDEHETLEFDDLLPSACAKFNCPYVVAVRRESQLGDHGRLMKLEKPAKQKKVQITTPFSAETKSSKSNVTLQTYDSQTVVVGAVRDTLHNLVELRIHQAPQVPRVVLQVIALFTPYFENLTKISIRRCRVDFYTIYELNKMLEVSNITDIFLEDASMREANYAILLDKGNLKHLSLCRCSLNDAVCKEIAARLHHNASSGNSLLFLNLSSNQITDVGAKYLGEALRTNRSLIYLNLSDNSIGDAGASCLLDCLCEFPLTHAEVIDKRSRHLKYLRKKQNLIRQFLTEQDGDNPGSAFELGVSKSDGSLKKKRSSASVSSIKSLRGKTVKRPMYSAQNKEKAESMSAELLGPFVDIFSKSQVTVKNDWIYCKGNLVLSSLNLSYNHLSYFSVKKILCVLDYQNLTKKQHEHGLVRVLVEGNPLPESCAELANISFILEQNLSRFGAKTVSETNTRRKSRAISIVNIKRK